jgi:hypothetical protein
MKGTSIQVTDSATTNVTNSTFLNNMGTDLAQGTIALAGTNASRLFVNSTLFDGNFAFLGGCFFIVRALARALLHHAVCVLFTYCALTFPALCRAHALYHRRCRLSPCS